MDAARRWFLRRLPLVMLAAPLAAEGQTKPKVSTVGILHSGQYTKRAAAIFEQGLREVGWIKGHNLVLEYRSADGDLARLPALARALVELKVDVIVAVTGPETTAARLATRTIPIVFVLHGDPVGTGDVGSLARPGGNITGLAQMHPELATKQLELLKQLGPGVARVAVLWNSAVAAKARDWRELKPAAGSLGLILHSYEIRSAADFGAAFGAIKSDRPDALLILGDPLVFTARGAIVDFAAKERLPAMGPWRPFVDAGGLVSYGADTFDLWRRAPAHVDKILRGTQPAQLPVEQAQKFELVINLKTAKALGLTIPPSLLLRADQVIE